MSYLYWGLQSCSGISSEQSLLRLLSSIKSVSISAHESFLLLPSFPPGKERWETVAVHFLAAAQG